MRLWYAPRAYALLLYLRHAAKLTLELLVLA